MREIYRELIHWARSRGIELNGIKPQTIPGRGTGMFATRELEAGETLVVVPSQALCSLHNVPEHISGKLLESTTHCILAAYLSQEKTVFAAWNAAFPTLASFESNTPLMWPPELQNFLPRPAKEILEKQQRNFQRDWGTVSKTFPHVSQKQYLHAWLLVNTRSFYYITPIMERLPHDDRLALLPVADLFNHADVGCESTFSLERYIIAADRAYRSGDEIHFCYGQHSNDFLLTEYGFLLTGNRWDAVCLDDMILPSLGKEQKDVLEKRGFLGTYLLDPETAGCFRTQVALRVLCCTHDCWRRFADAEVGEEACQRKVNVLLMQLLGKFLEKIHQTLDDVMNLKVDLPHQRELLAMRWKEIGNMVIHTINRLDV